MMKIDMDLKEPIPFNQLIPGDYFVPYLCATVCRTLENGMAIGLEDGAVYAPSRDELVHLVDVEAVIK